MLLGGRYELGDVIGTGGMARVHRARDLRLDRWVAIKVFRDDLDAEAQARAEQEMQTLAGLHHPGLVLVHDAGSWDGRPYLVMELVDGPTLTSDADLRVVGEQVADALAYVHACGVVHRDVKPANVLLSPSGAKLTDFGIARVLDGARHTSTGLTVGTAPYLAPEQVTGDPITPATDVYALGLVLLELLTGVREYQGAPVEAALARLRRSPHVPADLAAPWPALLSAMTARIPSQRPTAAEVADVLRGEATVTMPVPMTAAVPTRVARVVPAGPTRVLAPAASVAAGSSWWREAASTDLVRMAAGAVGVLLIGTAIAASASSPSSGSPSVAPSVAPVSATSPAPTRSAAPVVRPAAVVKPVATGNPVATRKPAPVAVPRKHHKPHAKGHD